MHGGQTNLSNKLINLWIFLLLHMNMPDFPDLNDLLLNLSHIFYTSVMVFSYKIIQWDTHSSVWFWIAPIERLLFQIFFYSQICSKRVRPTRVTVDSSLHLCYFSFFPPQVQSTAQAQGNTISTLTVSWNFTGLINSLFLIKNTFFLAALGLVAARGLSSSCGEGRLLFVAVRGLLIEVASLVTEHGL